jgi:hypothetical protein
MLRAGRQIGNPQKCRNVLIGQFEPLGGGHDVHRGRFPSRTRTRDLRGVSLWANAI